MQEEEQEKEEECEDLVPYGNLMIRNVVCGNEEEKGKGFGGTRRTESGE